MNKTRKSTIFKTSLLVALVGTAFSAQAAGLGRLTVFSAIGEPLKAELSLTATPAEMNGLTARLAPHSAFEEAGVEFMPALTGLRFHAARKPDGNAVLHLTTDAPLSEPFLHFLVELSWTSGRMVREYTFLLDPPEMLQAARPASVVSPARPAVQPVPVTAPAPVVASPTARPAAAEKAAGEVKVKPGDTLTSIAREHKPESVSLDQMLVALFNSNREVFDGQNMNRLRAGRILRLPDPAEAAQVDGGEARKLIVSQARDFNAYKRRLAEAAASTAAPETAGQEASGRIKPEMEGKAPPPAAKDRLEVSRTEAGKSGTPATGKAGLEEELIAREKALKEASERIAHLEKNLENLKSLVELKSEAGAKLQQQAQPAEPAKTAVPEPAKSAEPAKPAADEPAPPPAPAKPAQKPAAKKPVPPPPPPPEPDFVAENPELVFGGGGIVALLLGYLGFAAWRKKKKQAQEAATADGMASVPESGQNATSGAVFGAGSESVDSGEVSIQGDFSEGGVLTTEESVDPVAEADVLMAYGRDKQAEEILREGMKTDPARTAIHLKLLELYANRKDGQQFEAVAKNLHELNNGQGADWDKAQTLARSIGVTGGLFAASTVADVSQAMAAPEEFPAPAEAAPAPVPQAEEIAPVADQAGASSLDFDLDLGTTSSTAVAAEAETAAAPAAEEVMSLDFDFDLGTPEPAPGAEAPAAAEPAAAEPAAAPAEVAAADDGNAIDFAFDIEPAAAAEESGAEATSSGAADNVDFDLDLGASPSVEPETPVSSPVPSVDLADISLDLDEDVPPVAEPEAADAGIEAGEVSADELVLPDVALPEPEPKPESAPDIDLALDADLPAATEAGGEGDASALPEIDFAIDSTPADAEVAAEASDVADNPEVATKLELAQAYEEMGDREGARELLNEVLNEGSPAQQAQARARLDQLEA